MADEGIEYSYIKPRSKMLYGDQKVKLFERSAKIFGPKGI